MKRKLFLGLLLVISSGCSSLTPGVFVGDERLDYEPADDVTTDGVVLKRITPDVILQQQAANAIRTPPGTYAAVNGYRYRIGANDILSVIVWDHPELTIPAGEFRTAEASGYRVDASGNIFFPYVGEIRVAGKTTTQIRRELSEKLSTHIPSPQLDVRVVAYRSQFINVSGQVAKPQLVPISDEPMTLMRVINASGGVTEKGDLSNVQLIRKGEKYTADLRQLFEQGDLSQDRLLRNNDVVYIPDLSSNRVFVMGEVNQQAALIMPNGRMTLADALGDSKGMILSNADARRVFVIRKKAQEAQPVVYHLDLKTPEGIMLSTQFPLNPRDVVYIETSDVAKIERILKLAIPALRVVDTFSE